MSRSTACILLILAYLLLLSFSSNPPPGRTGGPGENTCATIGCHSGINVAIDGHIELKGVPQIITAGTKYPLEVQLIIDRGTPLRGGFQIMALDDLDQNIGGFSNPGDGTAITESNGRNYLGHAPAKNFNGADTLVYSTDWIWPSEISSDSVYFYAAANFANGNGGTSGDRIVTFKQSFARFSSDFSIEVQERNPSCPDTPDGVISIVPSGGTQPYSYLWSSGQRTHMDSMLLPGIYSITVTDSVMNQNCVVVDLSNSEDLLPPVMICLSDTLTINSCAPFSYPRPQATDNCGAPNVRLISGKGPNQSFEPGLHLEVYEAIDQSGNTAQCTIFINNSTSIDPEITINNIPCHEDSLGSAIISVTGANGPFEVLVQGDSLSIDALPQGEHTLLIRDQTGCTWEEQITISRPDNLQIDFTSIDPPFSSSSGDGGIEVMVTGGTPPYSFLWRTEDESFSTEQNLFLLFPGEYVLQVEDNQGCLILSDTITLDAITATIDPYLSQKMSVWPNPAREKLFFTLDNELKINKILLFNSMGQLYQSNSRERGVLDVQNAPPGLYHLVLVLEDGRRAAAHFVKGDN